MKQGEDYDTRDDEGRIIYKKKQNDKMKIIDDEGFVSYDYKSNNQRREYENEEYVGTKPNNRRERDDEEYVSYGTKPRDNEDISRRDRNNDMRGTMQSRRINDEVESGDRSDYRKRYKSPTEDRKRKNRDEEDEIRQMRENIKKKVLSFNLVSIYVI